MGSGAKQQVDEVNKPNLKNKATNPEQQKMYPYQYTTTPDNLSCVAKVELSPPLEGTVALTEYTVAADLQDLDAKIKSMMKVSENKNDGRSQAGFKRICKVCGKEGSMRVLVDHIEAKHITGVSHTCNICGKSYRSRIGLRQHKAKLHTTGN